MDSLLNAFPIKSFWRKKGYKEFNHFYLQCYLVSSFLVELRDGAQYFLKRLVDLKLR
jgi:hypothetical protein